MSRIAFGDLNAESISKWVKNKKGFLVYLGAPGIGKTYLCSALIPWVHHKFRSYRYWKERDFLSRLRSSMEGSGDYIREISYMMDDEFIMVDDVGSCGFNEWRSEVLFSMIDFRYESGKPTVITSNLTRQALTEGLGLRAASRLFASENLVIEIHEGQDLRKDGM
jgi:DNA replication protein DnaC